MPRLSLKKILIVTAIILAITHLPELTNDVIAPVFEWFSESLSFIKEFSRGMQAAMAFGLIVLVFVVITKPHWNK